MSRIILTIYEIAEKLPEKGVMILADSGHEWDILLSDGTDTACAWEEEDEPMRFVRWAYLGDLNQEQP